MSKLRLSEREVPIVGEYDAVIVGGGTAGAVAAIACGREKLRTLVIEQFGSLGGSQTMALVTPMMHNHIEGNPYSSAIDEEICDRMIKNGYGIVSGGGNKGWFDPQMLKVILEDMVEESGCELLYHTVVTGVVTEDKEIKAITISNKDGMSAVKAKVFIDCTGDADLAYLSGLPVESGNHKGINQAISLRFQMTNVDCDKFSDYLISLGQDSEIRYPYIHTAVVKGGKWPMNPLFEKMCSEGVLTEQDLKYFQLFSVPGKPNDLAFNCPELGGAANVLEPFYQSRKQVEGKRAIRRLAEFLVKYIPGFENAYICDIAALLGIRESRRITAEYKLIKDDILNYSKFEDGIARSNYPLDIHGGDSGDELFYSPVEAGEKYFEIPYRSIVVAGVNNLLAAGRCIGTDFLAQSTIRIQQTCRAMGEAAGYAAKLAVSQGLSFREVNGAKVRQIMRDRGAKL